MKFQFRPYGRGALSDQAFLDDLRRVADLLGRRRITMAQYVKYGKYRVGTHHRFGYWGDACEKAGLGRYRFLKASAKELVADIQAVGRRLNTPCMTLSQYVAEGRYSIYWIIRFYKHWYVAAKAAGLSSPSKYKQKTARELLENLEVVWVSLGRQPKTVDMVPPVSTCCAAPYRREFGGWQKALAAFVAWKSRGKRRIVKRKFIVHKTKRIANVAMRYRVLERDHFRCRACGQSPANDPSVKLQVDHIKPWTRGGETVLENLQTLCQMCNIGKGNTVGGG